MTPINSYNQMISEQSLEACPQQAQAMLQIEQCYQQIIELIDNPKTIIERINPFREVQIIKGIYLWGGVGIGKTCLMDIFYRALPADCKMRTHFHRFMKDIHNQLKSLQGCANPINLIAKALAADVKVLCFDEFTVVDIADAMLLANLLQALFDEGLILFTTSNLAPDDLYRNGLQRQNFIPAIGLIKKHCHVIEMTSTHDYRLKALEQDSLYYFPVNDETKMKFKNKFTSLVDGDIIWNTPITIDNREIDCIAQANDVIWFDFNAIVNIPRCQRDWLDITSFYQTIFISDVPEVGTKQDNLIRSFINMIDIFYDAHVILILQCESKIEDIYKSGRCLMEFARTQSRLYEMQSSDYLKAVHFHKQNTV